MNPAGRDRAGSSRAHIRRVDPGFCSHGKLRAYLDRPLARGSAWVVPELLALIESVIDLLLDALGSAIAIGNGCCRQRRSLSLGKLYVEGAQHDDGRGPLEVHAFRDSRVLETDFVSTTKPASNGVTPAAAPGATASGAGLVVSAGAAPVTGVVTAGVAASGGGVELSPPRKMTATKTPSTARADLGDRVVVDGVAHLRPSLPARTKKRAPACRYRSACEPE